MAEKDLSNQRSRWPVAEMLLRGTFATGTAEERRVIRSSRIFVVVLLVWAAIAGVTRLAPTPIGHLITMFLYLSLISYYAWEKRKYFLSLDELTRRIELEGMAWAYSLGVLGALWGGGIAYAVSLRWPINSQFISWRLCFLFAGLLASVKGAYRYFATRKY
jgi:hypothetical protein